MKTRIRKSKKAQVKLFETIAILTVFFFLLIFGMSFYSSMQMKSFQREQKKLMDLAAVQIAQKTADMPELQCSVRNIPVDNCFDILKMESFDNVYTTDITAQDFYYDIFGYSTLSVEEIYPEKEKFIIYDNPLPNSTDRLQTKIPVSIYNPKTKRYGMGILYVDSYS